MTQQLVNMHKTPEWAALEEKSKSIKSELIQTMTSMASHQQSWKLPPIPDSFDYARTLMEQNDFNLVVCGEVKNGKSSLLNAIIGQEILPVGVKETTCQIFRISHSETESFSLFFTDGGRTSIKKEELKRYGSQTEIDRRGEPLLAGRMLQWIEVNVPLAFLPKGVHLVDTPGLGATYAAHTAITNRFVQEADAVIFVSDCTRELTLDQLDFIGQLLQKTEHILVLLTKIDQQNEEYWQALKKRNETLLNDRFKREKPWIVFPVSSQLLLDASNVTRQMSDREYSVEDSGFDRFREHFDKMSYKVSGWVNSVAALLEVNQYHANGLHYLNKQIEMLSAKSEEEKTRITAQLKKLQDQFESDWGPHGTEKTRVIKVYDDILEEMKFQGERICGTHSNIYRKFHATITRQTDFDSLQEVNVSLSTDVYHAIADEWNQLCSRTQKDFSTRLAGMNLHIHSHEVPAVSVSLSPIQKSDFTRKIQAVTEYAKATDPTGGFWGGLIGAGLSLLTGGLMAGPLIALGTTLGTVAGLGAGARAGMKEVKHVDLESARSVVLDNMQQIFEALQTTMNESRNGRSMIQNLTKDLKEQFDESLSRDFRKRQSQMESERQNLSQQTALGEKQRASDLTKINSQQETWSAIRPVIDQLSDQLKQIESAV